MRRVSLGAWKSSGVWVGGLLLGMILAMAIVQRQSVQAWYVSYQFQTATDPMRRVDAAERLLELQEAGQRRLWHYLLHGDETARQAVLQAWRGRVQQWPFQVTAQWLESAAMHWDEADEAGQKSLLGLVLPVLEWPDARDLPPCRRIVGWGLRSTYASVRREAVILSRHYGSEFRQEWLELLKDPDDQVRQAALFTVTTLADASAGLSDEELFHWLHDPDEGVRRICQDALNSRGRSVLEIDLGRRLTHPDINERLKLIAELRYDEVVVDPEPWFHHLVRDPEAAVRVAAVRAVAELRAQRRSPCPLWVEAVIRTDPDSLARRIMQYYQELPLRMNPGELRPAGTPP